MELWGDEGRVGRVCRADQLWLSLFLYPLDGLVPAATGAQTGGGSKF